MRKHPATPRNVPIATKKSYYAASRMGIPGFGALSRFQGRCMRHFHSGGGAPRANGASYAIEFVGRILNKRMFGVTTRAPAFFGNLKAMPSDRPTR